MKICTKCFTSKEDVSFPKITRNNVDYRSGYCNSCHTKQSLEKDPTVFAEKRKVLQHKQRKNNPVTGIISDTDKKDRRVFNAVNDLTPAFVRDLIVKDCVYCGSKDDLITLDRMDNNKPHNKDNVVAGCYRCNMLRGAMPYEAWLLLVPVVRQAYESGDFGDWKHKPKWIDPKAIVEERELDNG